VLVQAPALALALVQVQVSAQARAPAVLAVLVVPAGRAVAEAVVCQHLTLSVVSAVGLYSAHPPTLRQDRLTDQACHTGKQT
jgi:hypothetical protein